MVFCACAAVGPQLQHRRHLTRSFVGLLLAGTAVPVSASNDGSGSAAGQSQPQTDPAQQEIIVYGSPLFRNFAPERTLDEDAIASYGVSTIDELVGEVQAELGAEADQPLIIVNGQRINDLSEIGGLPVEALKNLQILPRGSALRGGGTSSQRVISINLKRAARSAVATVAHKLATDGHWNSDRGEGIFNYINGDTRANIIARVSDETNLLESDRGIIQVAPSFPYALGGNITGYPNSGGEIDPALSAQAGHLVTVVPLPAATPTLTSLAAAGNTANSTDVGQFRTLRPAGRNYDLNATFAKRLAPWLTGNATLRWNRSRNLGLRGLPGGLFVLPTSNPASPFSRTVGIAVYGTDPLTARSRRHGDDENVTLNAIWSRWQGNLNLRRTASTDRSLFGRATLTSATLDNSVNPFTSDLAGLITTTVDSTLARSRNSLADLTINGPLVNLPAGDVYAAIEGRLSSSRLRSESSFPGSENGTFRRNEQTVRGLMEIPLTSRSANVMPAVGDLSASLEYSRSHFSDAGNVNHYTYGLTWEPRPILRVHADIDRTSTPASIQTLGNPTIINSNARVFDPITGQTVDVTQITGGNPSLLPQKARTRNVSALLRLVPRLNLQLNAEYTDSDLRNFVSSLPQASAAITLAFPDRFVRDSNGVLTIVDLRPVNFESHREKRLRWGFSMNAKLAGGALPGTPGADPGEVGRRTYFQLTANHTIVFSDEIVIRPDLDTVDLLGGGAIGIGGGRVRHQLEGTAAINSGGVGARIGATWRGPSDLQTRIGAVTDTLQFSPLLVVNMRAFADLKRFLPQSDWARGLRLSIDAINVTNRRQRVRDSAGATPLQFQPAYRDPIGRTIEIELRKVF